VYAGSWLKLIACREGLKKRAVEIVRNIETDISFYLVMVTAINIAIGFIVMANYRSSGHP
jgi:hypothetical protein